MCVTKMIHVWLSWQDLLDIFSDSFMPKSISIFHHSIWARRPRDRCGKKYFDNKKILLSDFDALSVQQIECFRSFFSFPIISVWYHDAHLFNLRLIHFYSLFNNGANTIFISIFIIFIYPYFAAFKMWISVCDVHRNVTWTIFKLTGFCKRPFQLDLIVKRIEETDVQ